MNLNDIAKLNINGVYYCCIITRIGKNEAVKSLQKAELNNKYGTLENIKHLFLNIKMGENV